ncbi:unnamed protein product, partial [Iphiclides podalirius]
MLSYISSWFNYLFNKESNEDSDDDCKENYLAEQLVDLEYIIRHEEKTSESIDASPIPNDAICFQRTGVITFKDDNYVLIDGILYFDISACPHHCDVNDQVLYLGYKDSNDSIIVVRILENKGLFWGTENDVEENKFQVIEHIMLGEVDFRVERNIYIKESDLKFNLDDVEGTFIPVTGDWLELKCKMQLDEKNPSDISIKQVLTVLSFKPLRSKIINAVVDNWTGTYDSRILVATPSNSASNLIAERLIQYKGDPMQLGPVVTSKYCKEFGMDESYMSRILECYPYQKDYVAYKNGFDNRLITKLNDNYRSVEEIISLPSEMFYDASLVARIDRNQTWISKIISATHEVLSLDNINTGGLFVHGVRGFNARSEESPSWYNPQEASMVALTTCKLLRRGVTVDDIGIITPYIAQIKYLRLLFESMGLAQPKIGTVEEFQGQERCIILITTASCTGHNTAVHFCALRPQYLALCKSSVCRRTSGGVNPSEARGGKAE